MKKQFIIYSLVALFLQSCVLSSGYDPYERNGSFKSAESIWKNFATTQLIDPINEAIELQLWVDAEENKKDSIEDLYFPDYKIRVLEDSITLYDGRYPMLGVKTNGEELFSEQGWQFNSSATEYVYYRYTTKWSEPLWNYTVNKKLSEDGVALLNIAFEDNGNPKIFATASLYLPNLQKPINDTEGFFELETSGQFTFNDGCVDALIEYETKLPLKLKYENGEIKFCGGEVELKVSTLDGQKKQDLTVTYLYSSSKCQVSITTDGKTHIYDDYKW